MSEFKMPSLGADMSVGVLRKWLKKAGDPLEKGDLIAEVLTDKGIIDVEVFTSGVLEKILVEENQEVPVGTTLAIIREEGETPAGVTEPVPVSEPQRLIISPSARKLAQELGVDPAKISGTGPDGAITRSDVERVAAATKEKPAEGAAMRQAIAAAMSRSKREIPHYYLSTTIDMDPALMWLADENKKRPVAERLLYGVLLIKAAALALREVPELNAIWKSNRYEVSKDIHIGVAISLRTGGLIAPALHHADKQSLSEMMQRFSDLVQRARTGGLKSSELSDPTITITSLGEQGVDTVFPIIYPPQTAMIGFGRIQERPWVVDRQVIPRPLITATLSADHRVTDGHRGARFLLALERLLHHPENL
jgi:pyruvate dehydrogenase E2 component (dihydrolipoamide acetyltransferase)